MPFEVEALSGRLERADGKHVAGLELGVGFVARPIGGVVFGHYGDKVGRKYTFLVTVTLMGIATAAVSPTRPAATSSNDSNKSSATRDATAFQTATARCRGCSPRRGS